METRTYWEENGHAKYDHYNSNDGFTPAGASGELNFAARSEDEAEFPQGAYLKKGKVSRQDPMSHRIIEKRRRDRMNNCLADLSRLIPPEYLKKGRGRVEKTEIIEMAIRHLKYLQDRVNGLYHGTNRHHYVSPAYSVLKEAHVTGGQKREVASLGFCVIAAERQGEQFRCGYHEAIAETVRYLVDVHGHQPADGLCGQIAAHLHRQCERITKGEAVIVRQKPPSSLTGSSSETASSSSGSLNYKPSVITSSVPPTPTIIYPDNYNPEHQPQQSFQPMDCDRVPMNQMSTTTEGEPINEEEPLALLDARRKCEPTLRTVRKAEHNEDYLHSYKFKNSIERRFSRSQDFETSGPAETVSRKSRMSCGEHDFQLPFKAVDVGSNTIVCIQAAEAKSRNSTAHPHNKIYNHKRRRATKPAPSTSTSNSGSTEETRDTSPQDTSSDSPHHHYEKMTPQAQLVPVFALNALGKYYVPMSVAYSCLTRHLGPYDHRYDILGARAAQVAAPLHPVTIHVNFQSCLNYHVKREPCEREWRPA